MPKAGSTNTKTAIQSPGPRTTQRAVELLRAGQLVGLPTETVYGLAGDACSDSAVARIFELKQRPDFNPLIAHVSGIEMAKSLVELSEPAEKLMQAFWPGPMTLVLPRLDSCPVSHLASAGLETLALRCPDHPVAQDIIAAFDGPLAAPSANPSGKISPTRAEDVAQHLDLPLIIDGGACTIGVESTVAAVMPDRLVLLRPGAISAKQLQDVAGLEVEEAEPPSDSHVRSPGQLASHYAPNALVRLEAEIIHAFDGLLAFGPLGRLAQEARALDVPIRNLSAKGDLKEAAANLFAMLRELDALPQVKAIAVMPIPEQDEQGSGLGLAINDRLRRAAAPRPDPDEPFEGGDGGDRQ
ncbi:MAG: L-threonylcarbamoyladenylate synthase [Alphaproteobacteria bacterium]|nr:L-threonylcarbamoyladenylate synthase [Alphaproteobacteria bacterium]